jgi:hypothetical protein
MERIPVQLKCLFIIVYDESSVEGHLAFVQMVPQGRISQSTGIVIVEESHQPPMQPFHNASQCSEPLCPVGTTFIIPISMIQEPAHHSSADGAARQLTVVLEQYDCLDCFQFV